MKNTLGMIAAVLAFCCALVVGPASQTRAEECTTQGALALALADVLGIQVTTAQAAADALALRGIKPKLGWNVEACLTDEVLQEVKKAFANAGDFERALALISRDTDRKYPKPPVVSPAKP